MATEVAIVIFKRAYVPTASASIGPTLELDEQDNRSAEPIRSSTMSTLRGSGQWDQAAGVVRAAGIESEFDPRSLDAGHAIPACSMTSMTPLLMASNSSSGKL